jgi:hypothetical protein
LSLRSDGDNNSRVPLSEFLSCGSDASSIDIYGLNNYRARALSPSLSASRMADCALVFFARLVR